MIITNKWNLPEAIYKASLSDSYSRGNARMSITQLINPPRIEALRSKHRDQLSTDLSERIWALLGTAVHKLLEEGTTDGQPEERLFANVGGWDISGGVDLQRHGGYSIVDYKVTSVWSVKNDKPEWEHQLNCYAYLVWVNKGIQVDSLSICAVLRDWRNFEAKSQIDYPVSPIMMVPIKLWSTDEQLAYIENRINLHKEAQANLALDIDLPLCSDEDRWRSPAKWALYKEGGKRATKVYNNEQEAMEALHKTDGGKFEQRNAEPKRCIGNWCGVAEWCDQWQAEKNEAGGDAK